MINTAAMLKHGLQRCISIMIPHCFKLLKGTSGNVLERPRKSFILKVSYAPLGEDSAHAKTWQFWWTMLHCSGNLAISRGNSALELEYAWRGREGNEADSFFSIHFALFFSTLFYFIFYFNYIYIYYYCYFKLAKEDKRKLSFPEHFKIIKKKKKKFCWSSVFQFHGSLSIWLFGLTNKQGWLQDFCLGGLIRNINYIKYKIK